MHDLIKTDKDQASDILNLLSGTSIVFVKDDLLEFAKNNMPLQWGSERKTWIQIQEQIFDKKSQDFTDWLANMSEEEKLCRTIMAGEIQHPEILIYKEQAEKLKKQWSEPWGCHIYL